MKNEIILVLGGARSGKSSFAEKLIRDRGGCKFYLATAPVCDPEMRDRIARHQAIRAADHWTTIEEQFELENALCRAVSQGAQSILVDCLTLWINNLLYQNAELTEAEFSERAASLLQTLKSLPACIVLVINEVGLGLVPENPLARKFRDLSGRCAQTLAAGADEVYFLAAGLPLRMK